MRDTASIDLASNLNRDAFHRLFEADGRVHIPGILDTGSAERIVTAMQECTPWQLAVYSGQRHVDLSSEQLAPLPSAQQVLLVDAINKNAHAGFQYVFNNFPIYDLYRAGRYRDHVLMELYEFINSPPFLQFARDVTGIDAIAGADAQATLYRPGHFLTVHDDDVAGKDRLVAYVLNFSREWRADWGGILQFIDDDGHVAAGYTPTFNSLNLLRVPQRHAVSYVTPAAQEAGRYSVTGWLRRSLER